MVASIKARAVALREEPKPVDTNTGVSFRGVYKVTAPKVNQVTDKNEKNALAECLTNNVVMGCNMSIAQPRVNEQEGALYFKIDNKNDQIFEKGFNSILADCNKKFNVDMAKKVYMQKVSEDEYNKAQVLS